MVKKAPDSTNLVEGEVYSDAPSLPMTASTFSRIIWSRTKIKAVTTMLNATVRE
jgi:hypothetical protein